MGAGSRQICDRLGFLTSLSWAAGLPSARGRTTSRRAEAASNTRKAQSYAIKTAFLLWVLKNAWHPNALRGRHNWRRTQFGDQPQDVGEEVSWDRDLLLSTRAQWLRRLRSRSLCHRILRSTPANRWSRTSRSRGCELRRRHCAGRRELSLL